jgi:tetratricopeptide (TPR) repeat protein
LVLGSVALVAAAVGFVFVGLSRRHKPEPPRVASTEPALARGKRLLAEGDLDGADKILRDERESSDSAELQELMSEVAEQLGNRLGALAHMHRAIHLAPEDAEPRARLAALLLRLGQSRQACLQAQKALALDAGPRASSARSVVAHAKCRRAEPEARREASSEAVPRRLPPEKETK